MRLTARFGLKRVEDPVGDVIDAERVPVDGQRLGKRQLTSLL